MSSDRTPTDHSSVQSGLDDFLAPFLAQARRSTSKSNTKTARASTRRLGDDPLDRIVLSLFDVPPALLLGASHRGASTSEANRSPSSAGREPAGVSVQGARGLTCVRCGLTFDSRPVQLEHFKTGLHMTNLRRQLAGKPPLSQQDLDVAPASVAASEAGSENMESASSSDSEEEDASLDIANNSLMETFAEEGEEEDDAEGSNVATNASGGLSEDSRGRVRRENSLREGPRLVFAPDGSKWCFSISSAALGMERGDDPWHRLDNLLGGDGGGANRLWAVVVLQSGKFAAAVFEGQTVLCHKAFKRYTIRAKRGGSQSSYDSGGRRAQSAGATLRRYGEQSLRDDARAIFKDWREPLKACRVVLTSVPKGMRTVLFDGKDAPFERKDKRLRPLPFAVGKPVFEEVVAAHTRVTSIVFSDASAMDEDSPAAAASEPSPAAEKVAPAPKPDPEVSGENRQGRETAGTGLAALYSALETEQCAPSKTLIDACERGDAEATEALLNQLELDDNVTESTSGTGGVGALPQPAVAEAFAGLSPEDVRGWTAAEIINRPDGLQRLMTPLHVASAAGHFSVLKILLERGASPEAEDVRGRVPFLLAVNKDTRDAFRRARAQFPERWDWNAARVPEPLTEELEQRQKERLKEKEKEKKRRAKLKKKTDKERAEAEARRHKEKAEAEAEDRRRKGLAAIGHCDSCGGALVAKKAFSRLEYRYCSVECVSLHKRKLAADAAERRFAGESEQA